MFFRIKKKLFDTVVIRVDEEVQEKKDVFTLYVKIMT